MTDHEHRSRNREFRDLALPHLDAVARYALSLARNEADADDLVQDTFLRAYRSWHQFVPGSACRAWLFTICRNSFRRQRANEHRLVACDDAEIEALAAAALHTSLVESGRTDMFDQLDVLPALRGAVDALPDQFRDVVSLVDVEGFAYREVAVIIGVPIGTVRSRLFRARRMLQERLMDFARDAGIGAGPTIQPKGERE